MEGLRVVFGNIKLHAGGEVSAVYDDPKRYENDGLYDEDTDYEYEADDSDYIVDDEDENENALWDDAEAEE